MSSLKTASLVYYLFVLIQKHISDPLKVSFVRSALFHISSWAACGEQSAVWWKAHTHNPLDTCDAACRHHQELPPLMLTQRPFQLQHAALKLLHRDYQICDWNTSCCPTEIILLYEALLNCKTWCLLLFYHFISPCFFVFVFSFQWKYMCHIQRCIGILWEDIETSIETTFFIRKYSKSLWADTGDN